MLGCSKSLTEDIMQQTTAEQPKPTGPRLVPLTEVIYMTGLSRPEIYRRIARDAVSRGRFPRPVKLGRTSRWVQSEVSDWIAAQIALRAA
jgi:prophage regulatory protein